MLSSPQGRRALATTVQDQKPVSPENGLGDYTPQSFRLNQAGDREDQAKQKGHEITHLGNRARIHHTSDSTSNFKFAGETVRTSVRIWGNRNPDSMRLFLVAFLAAVGLPQAPPAPLDFEFFKTRVQPVFLARRLGHARCYACHSIGTPFRLERLLPGATTWNDEQSRRNFEAAKHQVVPGDPKASPLLVHPLAVEAGGDAFHSGGKHWESQSNREWQAMSQWVQGQKAAR